MTSKHTPIVFIEKKNNEIRGYQKKASVAPLKSENRHSVEGSNFLLNSKTFDRSEDPNNKNLMKYRKVGDKDVPANLISNGNEDDVPKFGSPNHTISSIHRSPNKSHQRSSPRSPENVTPKSPSPQTPRVVQARSIRSPNRTPSPRTPVKGELDTQQQSKFSENISDLPRELEKIPQQIPMVEIKDYEKHTIDEHLQTTTDPSIQPTKLSDALIRIVQRGLLSMMVEKCICKVISSLLKMKINHEDWLIEQNELEVLQQNKEIALSPKKTGTNKASIKNFPLLKENKELQKVSSRSGLQSGRNTTPQKSARNTTPLASERHPTQPIHSLTSKPPGQKSSQPTPTKQRLSRTPTKPKLKPVGTITPVTTTRPSTTATTTTINSIRAPVRQQSGLLTDAHDKKDHKPTTTSRQSKGSTTNLNSVTAVKNGSANGSVTKSTSQSRLKQQPSTKQLTGKASQTAINTSDGSSTHVSPKDMQPLSPKPQPVMQNHQFEDEADLLASKVDESRYARVYTMKLLGKAFTSLWAEWKTSERNEMNDMVIEYRKEKVLEKAWKALRNIAEINCLPDPPEYQEYTREAELDNFEEEGRRTALDYPKSIYRSEYHHDHRSEDPDEDG